MPQIRNFFPKRPAVNLVPAASDPPVLQNVVGNGPNGLQRTSLTLRRSVDEKPNEYKMSGMLCILNSVSPVDLVFV